MIEVAAPKVSTDSARIPGEYRRRSQPQIGTLCSLVALALGAAAAWAARTTMYPDGISYLDVGDAYWRGDWHNAINAYWSPLYSWILGGFAKAFRPSLEYEYPLVHVVNFLLYVLALICFHFFLAELIKQDAGGSRPLKGTGEVGLPVWALYTSGYAAFITSSLLLITLSFPSADMAAAAVVYLAAALLLRIHAGEAQWGTFVLLGVALGIGYYAKTAMLLIAVPFLLVAAVLDKLAGHTLRRAALSFIVFLIVVAPFIAALSISKGRPTFGDSGAINYAVNVDKVAFFIPKDSGATHPIQRLTSAIEAYEYAQPIGGTYPLWYDPSYWHEGIHPHFSLLKQLRTLSLTFAQCCMILFSVFLGLHLSAVILFLWFVAPQPSRCLAAALRYWYLWIPAAAGVALYALVVIEPRYLGAQFCILWMIAFAGVRASSRRLITCAVLVAALATGALALRDIARTVRGIGLEERDIATPECPKVARALLDSGLQPGDKIAVVADWLFPSRQGAYISRLARIRMIGEARPDTFWTATDASRAELAQAFANAGAAALLTHNPPRLDTGWKQLAGTGYYVYFLKPSRNVP